MWQSSIFQPTLCRNFSFKLSWRGPAIKGKYIFKKKIVCWLLWTKQKFTCHIRRQYVKKRSEGNVWKCRSIYFSTLATLTRQLMYGFVDQSFIEFHINDVPALLRSWDSDWVPVTDGPHLPLFLCRYLVRAFRHWLSACQCQWQAVQQ